MGRVVVQVAQLPHRSSRVAREPASSAGQSSSDAPALNAIPASAVSSTNSNASFPRSPRQSLILQRHRRRPPRRPPLLRPTQRRAQLSYRASESSPRSSDTSKKPSRFSSGQEGIPTLVPAD